MRAQSGKFALSPMSPLGPNRRFAAAQWRVSFQGKPDARLGSLLTNVLARAIRDSPDRHVRNAEHVADLLERLACLPHLDRVLALGRTETRTAPPSSRRLPRPRGPESAARVSRLYIDDGAHGHPDQAATSALWT